MHSIEAKEYNVTIRIVMHDRRIEPVRNTSYGAAQGRGQVHYHRMENKGISLLYCICRHWEFLIRLKSIDFPVIINKYNDKYVTFSEKW